MGVPGGAWREAAARGAERWVGWKPTYGNADGCLYFLAFVFYVGSSSWVRSVLFFLHRAVEVGSIGVASFSIELGF